MDRRNENEPKSSTQKRTEKQQLKMNEMDQERDNIIPDTKGIIKHEINNMNTHELRGEISNQKIKYQPFLLK